MRIGCLFLAVMSAAPAAAQVPKRPLRDSDRGRILGVADARLAPNGQAVAYVRSTADYGANSVKAEVVVIGTVDGATRASWPGSSPAWSPDGSRIAFLAGRNGKSGIWIHDLATRADRFLVAASQSNAWLGRGADKNFQWSPDGKWIAFVGAEPSGPAPASDVKVFSRIMYKTNTGFTDNRRTHLWLVGAAGGEPRLLTPGRFDEHSLAWSPDSRRLAFVSDRSPDPDNTFRNDLFTLDVTTGAVTRLTDTPAAEFLPVWSPDGRWIAYEGWTRSANTKDSPAEDTKAYLIPAGGGVSRLVAPGLDRRVTEIAWHPSAKWIYFAAADHGAIRIYRAAPGDSVPTIILGGDRQVHGYSFDAHGAAISFLSADPTHPTELSIAAANGTAPRQLTHLHDAVLRDVALEGAAPFWFTSFDGTRVQGWVMKPAGFDPARRYPVIVNIHGGPHSAFGYGFSDRLQLEAATGYVVVFINPRGSIGYGQAFSDGSLRSWGAGDYQDLMAGLDSALAANPWMDSARVGVTGGSYGGFMTNWIITQTHRFMAAVSSLSLSNLISFYGTSLYTDLIESEFGGLPWDNYELLWKWSPLAHVKGVTTPTLFIHGEQDHDVPITQAEEMYTALRKQGVEATLARYPREGHGFHEPQHGLDADRRLLAWFDHYLKMSAATP